MTFEEALLETIDEALTCLGEQGKQAVYLHLKNKYALNKQDLHYRLEDFTEALDDTFQVGAKLLEIKMMKILFTKVGHGYVPLEKPENLEFLSYVYALRNRSSCFVIAPPLPTANKW